jgi:hypothetical protein
MEVFKLLISISENNDLHCLYAMVSELYRRAMTMIDAAAQERVPHPSVLSGKDNALTFGIQLEDDIELFGSELSGMYAEAPVGERFGRFPLQWS